MALNPSLEENVNVSEESDNSDHQTEPVPKRPNLCSETIITEIVKGNKILCTSTREKSFESVEHIHIKDEVQKLSLEEFTLHPVFSVDLLNLQVNLGSVAFKTMPNIIDKFVDKAKVIRDAISELSSKNYEKIIPIEFSAREGTDADSDNGVNVPDIARTNPFTKENLAVINAFYLELYKNYRRAKQCSFQNAYGKYFFSSLGTFVTLLDETSRCESFHSTNTHGVYQPGSLKVTWVTKAHQTRHGSSSVVEAEQERVSDFVVWDPVKNIYIITGEIKSSDHEPSLFQVKEQMIGLLKANQTAILGLVVWPSEILPIILKRSGNVMKWYYIQKVKVGEEAYFSALANLYISFIHLIDLF